jgi:hypothetical protein
MHSKNFALTFRCQERKHFFFEKKKQKTFGNWAEPSGDVGVLMRNVSLTFRCHTRAKARVQHAARERFYTEL